MITLLPPCSSQEASILHLAETLCRETLEPFLLEDEQQEYFRKSVFDSFKQAGLTALLIPKAWGGLEQSPTLYYRLLALLARYSASFSITVGVHQMIQAALLQFGSEDQKQQFLKPLATGNALGAFSLSESGSGSDASALKTTATLTPQGYRINGSKLWCSNGSDADLFLVMARTGEAGPKGISAFIVLKDTPGFSIGKKEKKLGLKTSSLTELVFEQCLIPTTQLLGREGEGFKVALSQLDAGRIGIAATALGLAHEALERVWTDGCNEQFAFPVGLRSEWATHYASLQAAHSLLLAAARERELGNPITAIASQCKLFISDLAMRITSDAVETAGYAGVQPSFGLERLMRDSKALQIVEGTNQIQKLVLSRELEKQVQA